ncbi:DUF6764 family protein [Gordonia sp. NPDC003585]|uniref:DUF6764 family protein n=1 Tax=unclassified Gordonia (in: high G+C Gram-positive bacteria) TaxID=2657482 RepID=UPI0033B0D9A8
MRINRIAARVTVAVIGGAGLVWLAGISGGQAGAATCNAANGQQVERVHGTSGCGAKAGPGSAASAEERSSGGTAVAVAANRGHARALNLQPGSSALAGANTGGNAFAVTTGPKGLSVAQARQGGNAIAIGGWGGQAYAGPAGAACSGGFAAAADTTTGKVCLHAGSIDYRN